MPEYRRAFVPGGTYFFTLVTFGRRPFLTDKIARLVLHDAWRYVQTRHPFTVAAICLLPDHLHCIWTMPEQDVAYSIRWAAIKGTFSRYYLDAGGTESAPNASRHRRREVDVWQRRFWEHCIRDEDDFERHFDYIHYNPVKHGLVERPCDWPWSSLHRYVKAGYYTNDWGSTEPPRIKGMVDLGEYA